MITSTDLDHESDNLRISARQGAVHGVQFQIPKTKFRISIFFNHDFTGRQISSIIVKGFFLSKKIKQKNS